MPAFKLFIKQSLFLLIQFICLLCPDALPIEQIQNNLSVQAAIAKSQHAQEINEALLISAGIDRKLSDWEWKTFLLANPNFKYNKSNEEVIKIVFTLLKNAHGQQQAHASSNKAKFITPNELLQRKKEYAVLVYGNELTAVAAAVMASRGLKGSGQVILLRENSPKAPFGGLLVQGGLSYLDRNQINATLTPSSAFYEEFLTRAKVKRIAADPVLVDKALREMLNEAGVVVVSGARLKPKVSKNKIEYVEVLPLYPTRKTFKRGVLKAHSYIDATQNADLARQAGLKYSVGFETLGYPKATLPVSPVFMTEGLSVAQLQSIENSIIHNPQLMKQIKDKITSELNNTVDGVPPSPEFAKWLFNKLDKPMFVGVDFIDVRSIALGAAYHLHRNKSYDFKRGFLFDRPNIAVVQNGKLSWNALLYKVNAKEAMKLVENGSKPTAEMLDELKAFESWLHTFPQGKTAKVIAPEELYVRHSLNITDVVKPLTGKQVLHGGTPSGQAVGTFCYYFDVRGGIEGMKGKMPKPVFNFGIEHSLSKLDNLAIVGRASGYYGLAPAVGRILELNVSVASFVGAAAAISEQNNKPLNSITSSQAKQLVESLTSLKVALAGKDLSSQVEGESGII